MKHRRGKTSASPISANAAFSDATILAFGLGYCPGGGDTFTRQALKEGYKEEFLAATGLTIKREDGTYYDRFSTRVIFPTTASAVVSSHSAAVRCAPTRR